MNTTNRLREVLTFYANYDIRELSRDRGALAHDAMRLVDALAVFSTAETIPPASITGPKSLDEGKPTFEAALEVVRSGLSSRASSTREVVSRLQQLRTTIREAQDEFERRLGPAPTDSPDVRVRFT